jgi:superfamily II DNA or RNA helicase
MTGQARTFNTRQKQALFLLAGGRCAICGASLSKGWHADHVLPYSAGGATDVINGQALCPACNLAKGVTSVAELKAWPERIELRAWQERAHRRYQLTASADFLLVATPGAGKTIIALRIAYEMLSSRRVRRVCIVVPTSGLKEQWSKAAHRVGIEVDGEWSNRLAGLLADDVHGVVVTYAQVASNPDIFRGLCRDGLFVILDEIHHAGEAENLSWGPAMRQAFGMAYRRLLLSGTPFRTDGNAIPFVVYEEGRSKADFTYGYGQALADKPEVCRPVWFPSFEGRMEWINNGQYYTATFADDVDKYQQSPRLRAALSFDGEWLRKVIRDTDDRLRDIRLHGHPDAGALVVAMDQWHAHKICELIQRLTGEEAILVVSENPDALNELDRFKDGSQRWLVAVRMVSEGADIPRLRVGVYATNVVSELFFRQFVGRFVRWQGGAGDIQDSYVFIPADSRLVTYAQDIMEERNHQWEQESEALERERRKPAEPGDDTRGLFVTIGVTNVRPDRIVTDSIILTPDDLAYARDLAERGSAQVPPEILAKLLYLANALPSKPSAAQTPEPMPTGEPLVKVKKRLRNEVQKRVHRLFMATGERLSHAEIYARLKADGVEHNEATQEQLYARISLLDRWINEARDVR